ncbi:rac GTPase-activating protein 1 [Aplysia californica]|uniref:Rac GTPase-activating protein 1 n=1 Tax=Aplysia californica TaxID=6500 RepID=A0ABM0ZVX2_APLCA|nr:rac GTPase-activating protein 1 [Aplysia californica]
MTLGKNKGESAKSLVAPFDELMRKAKVLQSGCEAEFKIFTVNQDENRVKWLNSEQKNESMEDKLKRLEAQAATLETQLKHARLQAEYELQRRKTAEKEKDDMDRQIGVIRELLVDKNSKSIIHENDRERLAAFTSNQRLSTQNDMSNTRLNTIMERSASFLSDVSFDKTEEDPLSDSRLRSGRKWKRPSAPLPPEEEENTPPKRNRNETGPNDSVVTATITIDTAGKPSATVETSVPKLNKSFSEPSLDKRNDSGDSDDEAFGFQRNFNANNRNSSAKPRKSILKSTPETPMLRKANSAGRGLNRVHIFISKTVIKPETCVPCGKRIRFGKFAMKCKDCRAVCHPECKDRLPLPCIPSCPSTPGVNKLCEGLISDFAPVERPMIPRLIVNCANEVELRGLDEVGIYRVPGSDKDQKELKEKFLKGRYPNLSNLNDIHVICGCLKDFLRGLKEPLITYNLWPSFVATNDIRSRERCTEELCRLVNLLPQANRDTLAFLVQHLQNVAGSPACKMPASNLSKVFGPTVVGYSCQEPAPMQIMDETQKQNRVMERLLDIPNEFWADQLNMDEISLFPAGTPYTPDSAHAAPRSMLGPLRTPDMPDSYSHDVTRTQNTPRPEETKGNFKFSVKMREPTKPSRFFSSPLVH